MKVANIVTYAVENLITIKTAKNTKNIIKRSWIISHNGSSYNYHFIIKESAKEFKGEDIKCLGENTEKYITFSVPLKEINENNKLITYNPKFIDSYRFMNTSLSNLISNLSEINKNECRKCN